MSYLKPVVVASTMLVASLSAAAFADHMNYAATMQPQAAANLAPLATRNSPKSDVSSFNWEKRIFVGGLLNVDTVYSERGWATTSKDLSNFETPPFTSDSAHGSDIVINNANLFFDAKINNSSTAHVGVAYMQRPGGIGSNDFSNFMFYEESNVTLPAGFGIDEAYLTFHDCSSPFYFQAGKKFTSFGNYNPYPVTYSLTQLLAQTNEEVLEFGYIANDGFNASIYAFNGLFSGKVSDSTKATSRINNYGVDAGYSAQYDNINYNLGLGYVKDVRDSSFLAHRIFEAANTDLGISRSAAAYSLHGEMNNGPLMLSADYLASARQLFDKSKFNSDSRVWAYDLAAGYGFDSMSYASTATLGYQRSGNASFLRMPRYRVLADYTVDVSKNAKVTLQYTHSRDYKSESKYNPATNNTTHTATLRLSVAI